MLKRWTTGILLAAVLAGCGSAPLAAFGREAGGLGALAKGRDAAAMIQSANAPLRQRNAEVIRQKYQLMADSAFSFYRATAYVYYRDAASAPELESGLRIPLNGDVHLENLGTYRSAFGPVAYDLNDFDEAFSGPYTWELARCAVSILLAAEEGGLSGGDGRALVHDFLQAYAQTLPRQSAAELAAPLTKRQLSGPASDCIDEAEGADRAKFLDKLLSHGRFKPGKKIAALGDAKRRAVTSAVAAYAARRREGAGFFQVKDVAGRIAGTASLGRYRYVALVEGPSASEADDVVLELKEEVASVGDSRSSGNQAQRVLKACQFFLPGADPLLGTTAIGPIDFLVRELSPAKNDVALEDLKGKKDFGKFLNSVALVVARAHARSGKGAAIAHELGQSAPKIEAFAERYLEQVHADHKAFKQAL